MNYKLENSNKYKSIIALMSVLATVVGVLSVFMGHSGIALLPAIAGILATVFLLEKGRKRILSYIIPLTLIIIEAVVPSMYSVNCLASTVVAIIFYLAFTHRKYSKAEMAGYATVFVSLVLILMCLLFAFSKNGNFSIDEALAFYEEFFKNLKSQFIDNTVNVYGKVGMTAEQAEIIYNTMMSTMFAILVIFAFILVGLGFKVFSLLAFRYLDDKDSVMNWRFVTSNVFAYFYLALMLLNMFTGSGEGVFDISVNNLFMIFTAVYLYVGFGFAVTLLTPKFHKLGSIMIVVLAMFILSTFAIQLLAIFAAIFTIMGNKVSRQTKL